MKTRINLLVATEKFHKRASYWHQFKIISLITGIITTSLIATLLFLKNNNATEIKKLTGEIDQLNYSLTTNKGDTQKQKRLANRLSLINDITNNSIDYQQILAKIDKHFNRYQLNGISINVNREITIQLTLKNKQMLLELIDQLQSRQFRGDFSDIKISSFSYPPNDDPIDNYSITAKVKI